MTTGFGGGVTIAAMSHVLVLDDDQDGCDAIASALRSHGFEVTATTNAEHALRLVATEELDVVISDLVMPAMNGLEVCERVHGTRPDLPVIMITGQGSLESAISAIRYGAYDFILKPVDTSVLMMTVTRAIEVRKLRGELKRLRDAATEKRDADSKLVGDSGPMRKVYELIDRVAESDASILIHGETGTGKELIAHAIHTRSHRKRGPFVAINCAAVPPSLIESELFGHARGAFTDAKEDRKGLFVQANGGTLFLDEVAELPIEMQPKLLRSLQERVVRPVGGNAEIAFDCRIVTATNRNLEDEVYEKRFREDLYYRINVVKVDLPPLRERGGDVLILAQFFLKQFAARSGKSALELSDASAEKLISYGWPGNVRELENCMEHAVALARFEQITVEDLPQKIRAYRPQGFVISADGFSEVVTMEEVERRYILRVLALAGGNKSQAAQVLGFDRRTMYRKLARYAESDSAASARPSDLPPSGD